MNKRRSSIFAVLGFSLIAYSSSVRAEQEFTDLVAKVMPSVVNIAIEAMGQRVKLEQSGGDLAYATYVVEYVGAGSIVDPSGLIITNRHVVKDAYEIDVTLSDGATFKGQLLGAGSGTDLAILKIDAGRPLPAIEIGNSDEVKVGEKVIAIGNPLGLASSVSAGIVSGVHRSMKSLPQYEFIQTDASINHGNSGGPLINMKGQMIGIDNQIWSDTMSGGSIGLGFAIPSNDAQLILTHVLQYDLTLHIYERATRIPMIDGSVGLGGSAIQRIRWCYHRECCGEQSCGGSRSKGRGDRDWH